MKCEEHAHVIQLKASGTSGSNDRRNLNGNIPASGA